MWCKAKPINKMGEITRISTMWRPCKSIIPESKSQYRFFIDLEEVEKFTLRGGLQFLFDASRA
jgi:hypothetical protein